MSPARKAAAVALVIAAVILANVLATLVPLRLDWTRGSLYTLSPATHKVLRELPETVTVQLYYSSSREGVPVMFKNWADRVREMLRQYARAGGSRVTLEIIDPQPDTPEEENATRLGLQGQTIPATGDRFFLGVVATLADQKRSLPWLDPTRERFLEYDLTQLLFGVQQLEKPRLGLLTSLPLAPQEASPFAPGSRPSPGMVIYSEWERSFEIVPVDAASTELPDGLAALAVLHPQGIGPALEFAIDQFVLSGRPTLIAVDPASRWFRAQNPQGAMFGGPQPNLSSDLPRLFKAWGVAYDAQQLVGDLDRSANVNAGGRATPYPLYLSLTAADVSDESPATSLIQRLLFPEAGAFSLAEGSKTSLTPLVRSSERSGTVAGMLVQFTGIEEIARSVVPSGGPRTVAALLRGPLSTAFPDGAPPAGDATAAGDARPAPSTPPLRETAPDKPALVCLVADTDWLLDAFALDQRFQGSGFYVPANDNLALATNLLETFAGSPDLVAIRGKETSLPTFTVVEDIERRAEERYQSQLQALEEKLRAVEQELSKIQGEQSRQGLLIATPELRASIENYRNQEAEMRAERRRIRRAKTQEIDALEHRLILTNALVVPAGVVASGIVLLWRRRSRRATTQAPADSTAPATT